MRSGFFVVVQAGTVRETEASTHSYETGPTRIRGRATRWAKALPLPIVQRLAGHNDIKTTMHYVHVSDDDVFAAMTKEQGGYSDERATEGRPKTTRN
jgi:integrase